MSLPALRSYPRSAYIDPSAELRNLRNLTPAQHGWGRGWPDQCPTKAQLATPEIVRARDGRIVGRPVRRELAPLFGKLFTYAALLEPEWELRFAAETHGGQGGVACRAISGTNTPSNHSQGRAWDVNSKGNPMRVGKDGAAVNFISRQPPVLIELAAAALCYWGGWYWDARHSKTGNRYYVDSMHLEFVGRTTDVARAIAQLDAKYDELRPKPPPEEEMSREDVLLVQRTMNEIRARDRNGRPLVEDGIMGPLTRSALEGAPAHVQKQLEDREFLIDQRRTAYIEQLGALENSGNALVRQIRETRERQ